MSLLYRINRMLPFSFLPIARIKTGRSTCTLYRNGWVLISDGKSSDALPINFCGPEIVRALQTELGVAQ